MDNTTIVPPLIQIYTMGETYESKSEEKTVLVLAILLFVCYFFRKFLTNCVMCMSELKYL